MPKKSKKPPPIFLSIGAPEWMATYSDMMSLLLCFFILLFSVAEEKQEKVFEVIEGFQQYFQNKGKKLGYYPKKITLRQIPGFLKNAIKPPSKTGSRGKSLTKRDLIEKVDQYASIYKEDNHQLVVIPGMVLFERGKAEIRDEAKSTMKIVANLLRKRVRTDIKVVGHTSSLPLGPEAKASDHLTLGFLRAKAVSRLSMITFGLDFFSLRADPRIPPAFLIVPNGMLIIVAAAPPPTTMRRDGVSIKFDSPL